MADRTCRHGLQALTKSLQNSTVTVIVCVANALEKDYHVNKTSKNESTLVVFQHSIQGAKRAEDHIQAIPVSY